MSGFSVFEDRHISCRSWVITNTYVYAFNPIPAEDRGPSIMWHYIQNPVFDRECGGMYIYMLTYTCDSFSLPKIEIHV